MAYNVDIDSGYRTLVSTTARALAATIADDVVYVAQTSGELTAQATAASPFLFYFSASELTATGKSIRLRLVGACAVNDVAPGVTLTFGLYPVTEMDGGTAVASPTLGTVVDGSEVAFVTPAANSLSAPLASTDFKCPSDGLYAFGCLASEAMAADSVAVCPIRLEFRYISS